MDFKADVFLAFSNSQVEKSLWYPAAVSHAYSNFSFWGEVGSCCSALLVGCVPCAGTCCPLVGVSGSLQQVFLR